MIAHAGKVGGLHQFTVLQIAISLVSTIAIVDQFSRELLFIAFPPNPPDPIEDEVKADMVLVVDRHMPVNRIAFADPSLVAVLRRLEATADQPRRPQVAAQE